ncbi:hypothetical protein Taro_003641 [Colocasia esculenta]|uniref:Uncharacterized protein n=1 Tax=Colocasia esculenta TaxID=4460 RepID=A0A843TSD9_COLES|nr:hypothetical protein [Colocasia esculenta]
MAFQEVHEGYLGGLYVQQLHKIFKLCGSPSEDYWRKSTLPHATIFKPQQPYGRCVMEAFKDFPVSALALMDVLLSIDPADRGTAAFALKSEAPLCPDHAIEAREAERDDEDLCIPND